MYMYMFFPRPAITISTSNDRSKQPCRDLGHEMVNKIQSPRTFDTRFTSAKPSDTSRLHAMVDSKGYRDQKKGSGGRLNKA